MLFTEAIAAASKHKISGYEVTIPGGEQQFEVCHWKHGHLTRPTYEEAVAEMVKLIEAEQEKESK